MKNSIFKILLLTIFLTSPLLAQPDKATLTLRGEPDYFSPNNDDLQDQVFFYPVLRADSEATRWRLDIKDSKRRRVARFTGAALPALLKWDGFDKKGFVVPDGVYVAELWAKGSGFDLLTRYQFRVDTKPPEVSLSVSTPVLDGAFLQKGSLGFSPGIRDESPFDRWQLQIIDSSGRTLEVFWSSGSLREVQWNGVDRASGAMAPPGPYRSAFVAWDKAGNESPPAFADFSVHVTVREMLQQTLNKIHIIETPIGLIVQLNSDDLFAPKRKKLVLTEKGKGLLREVGILVNAYAETPVMLEGYSKKKKNHQQDRDLASFYAWNVYSYLVKQGNVKASRLSVKGRGRSALFSRRGVDVPAVANGVEVLLEGNREW